MIAGPACRRRIERMNFLHGAAIPDSGHRVEHPPRRSCRPTLVSARIHIGTSGFHYKHWNGTFYPEGTRSDEMLAYYVSKFDTLEINATFYKLVDRAVLEAWRAAVPREFVFAAKGSRFLTHMKKLREPELALDRYFERVDGLGRKLGPVLFQLPPNWRVDLQRLEAFLRALPPVHRYAFELRDPSWHIEPVFALLRRYGAAHCLFDLGGYISPFDVTTDFAYVRLHGPADKYRGRYSRAALRAWAKQIESWSRTLDDVYVYFDNDEAGYAPMDALDLLSMVGASTRRKATAATRRSRARVRRGCSRD